MLLNPFPGLLVYGILAPLILRVAVGAALFYLAVYHYRERRGIMELLSPIVGKMSRGVPLLFILVEVLTAVAFIVGAYIQIAALIACVLFLKSLMLKARWRLIAPLPHTTYLLLCVISISLLLSGAGGGVWAFDLPL